MHTLIDLLTTISQILIYFGYIRENLYRKALIGPYDEEGTRTETVTIKRKAPGIGFFEDQPTAPEAENEGDKDGEGSVKKRKIISVKRGRYRIETEEDKGKVTETKTLIEGERLYDAETGEELEDRSAE